MTRGRILFTYCPDRLGREGAPDPTKDDGISTLCRTPEPCRASRRCATHGHPVEGYITPEGEKVPTP